MSSNTSRTIILLAVMTISAVPALLSAQAPIIIQRPQPPQPTKAPPPPTPSDALEKLKSGDLSALWLEMVVKARTTEAVPVLEKQFLQVSDPDLKAHIASALDRLGETSQLYWNYLADYTARAVESDMPDIEHYDENGKPMTDPSPAFLAWAGARHLSLEAAGEQDTHRMAAIVFLAMTGDPRGTPLLRLGLVSPNYLIESLAARGLAEAKDTGSVPLIIEACKRAPAAWRGAIAQGLVYLDDPDAQRAVDEYVPKDLARDLRAEHAKGKGPFS